MLQKMARLGKLGLKRFPFVGSIYRTIWHLQRCRRPFTGNARQIERRLKLLSATCRDYFPPTTTPGFLAPLLVELAKVEAKSSQFPPRKILFFSLKHNFSRFCLPLAVVLAARGCEVDYVWMPYMDMLDDNPADAPFLGKASGIRRLLPGLNIHPRLRLINLLNVPPSQLSRQHLQAAERAAVYDTHYRLRREVIDFNSDEARKCQALRLKRNSDCIARLKTLVSKQHYDSVLVLNGAVYEFAMPFELAKIEGLPVSTFDIAEELEKIWVTRNLNCAQISTDALWEEDAPHVLTQERKERIMARLFRREKPNWNEATYMWHGQAAPVQEGKETLAKVGLCPEKPTALLCTNIAYDTGVLGQAQVFRSMAEWVLETVDWFIKHPDRQLVVRCHPAEVVHRSNEPVPETIAARFGTLPSNIRVIRPEEPINTYSFLPAISFGLVYTSTVGLEMACRGIPAIVAGKVHYAGKSFTVEPRSATDYFAILQRAMADPASLKMAPRTVELALCYADVYFNKLPRPFPWTDWNHIEESLAAWPIKRILDEDCPAEFLHTIDYLAGRRDSPYEK